MRRGLDPYTVSRRSRPEGRDGAINAVLWAAYCGPRVSLAHSPGRHAGGSAEGCQVTVEHGASTPVDSSADPADGWMLLDALLYSASHDLRSPLLTMTLSADLVEEASRTSPPAGPGGVPVALGALRQAATDLERMLQALTLLSRARRKVIEPSRSSLRLILGEHLRSAEEGPVDDGHVSVDAMPVRELLDVLGAEGSFVLAVRVRDQYAEIAAPAPEGIGDSPSPLVALVGALHQWAGTAVETLAVKQVLLERQGAVVRRDGDQLLVALPLAPGGG
jgi:signal transduction histidine kinase